MSYIFQDEGSSTLDLNARINPEHQAKFAKFGHLQIQGAFIDRLYIIYKSNGLKDRAVEGFGGDSFGFKKANMPTILATLKVIDFECDEENGCSFTLQDTETLEEVVVGHIPTRLFDFDVFMSIPAHCKVKWDLRTDTKSKTSSRSLSFAVLVKTANRADFHSEGNTYCCTPNEFAGLFPGSNFKF